MPSGRSGRYATRPARCPGPPLDRWGVGEAPHGQGDGHGVRLARVREVVAGQLGDPVDPRRPALGDHLGGAEVEGEPLADAVPAHRDDASGPQFAGGDHRAEADGAVAEVTAQARPVPIEMVGFPGFLPTGSVEWLFAEYGLSPEGILAAARRALARKGA